MKRYLALISGALKLALVTVAAALIAGCVITSKEPLVPDAEAVAALPATFYIFGYNEDPAGYIRTEDAPAALSLTGNTYASDDGSMTVRFAPLAEDATYLAAINSEDGNIYGIARYRNNILTVDVILSDRTPGNAIKTEAASGNAGSEVLKDVVVEEGGVTVTTRAALDYLMAMHLAGKLPMAPVVAYIGESADATTPARLVKDGDFWKAE